jgi:hypothetical protein
LGLHNTFLVYIWLNNGGVVSKDEIIFQDINIYMVGSKKLSFDKGQFGQKMLVGDTYCVFCSKEETSDHLFINYLWQ